MPSSSACVSLISSIRFCRHRSTRVTAAYSRRFLFGPSVSPPTMASADFWCPIATPPDGASSRQGIRSPRVLRTHLHAYACRIYSAASRARIGLHRNSPAYPAALPHIRFLFVRPALCLQLPSDSQSPATPLPSANTSPCRVCKGLAPSSKCALPGARGYGGNRGRFPLFVGGEARAEGERCSYSTFTPAAAMIFE